MPDDGFAPLVHVHGRFEQAVGADAERARRLSAEILARIEAGGRYVVRNQIAAGGMGMIYLVWDQDLQRHSALKVIQPELTREPHRLRAFIAEGRITAQLEHPNIVPVHEIGVVEQTGCPFYTMKRVEGESLVDIIRHLEAGDRDYVRRYDRHRLLDIFMRVVEAVAYAHSRGVIHRDIKPENIMVGQFGEVLLMDWGLAKYVGTESGDDETRNAGEMLSSARRDSDATADGTIKGSLAYMAPEQAYGEIAELDYATDIFLLGSTLYHMLTCQPPYRADSVQGLIRKAERCDYERPIATRFGAQIPLALERIVLKAMAPLKPRRYKSAQALMDDIAAFQAGKRSGGRRVFAPGEYLMRAGEESKDTYVIIAGSVEVSRVIDDRPIPIAKLGPGEIVGEMAGITHQTRSATVVAAETTETLVISHDLMLEELEKLPPWMEKIVFSLADRVRILDEHVHPLMLKSRAFPVVNQLHYIYATATLHERRSDAVCYPRKALLDEISSSLGIDRNSCGDVLEVLQNAGLCILDLHDRVFLPRLDDFALFVDYCRHKFNIHGGIKDIEEIQIDPALERFFRDAVRELRRIGKQIEDGRPPAPENAAPISLDPSPGRRHIPLASPTDGEQSPPSGR